MNKKLLYFVPVNRVKFTNSKVDRSLIDQIAKEFNYDKFQAVTVYPDNNQYVLTDGNHRTLAAIECGLRYVPAILLNKEEFDYVKYSDRTIDIEVVVPAEPVFLT